jgi:hypothetical protein
MITLHHFLGSLRQLLQPAEFRIPTPIWPADWQATLRKLNDPADAKPTQADVDMVKRQREERERHKLLAEMATGLWKLRCRMIEPGGISPKDEFRREYRPVEAMWDALIHAGVEVHDLTGKPFEVGMSLTVLAYQPTPGVMRDVIHETHKPSVDLHGQPIQMGEVYVATPEKQPAVVISVADPETEATIQLTDPSNESPVAETTTAPSPAA